jgi:hypothetical protein
MLRSSRRIRLSSTTGLPAGTAKVLRSVIFFRVAARAVAFRKADNDLDTGA